MGETELLNGTLPFLQIIERSDKEVCADDGAISNNGNVIGTYVHGFLTMMNSDWNSSTVSEEIKPFHPFNLRI